MSRWRGDSRTCPHCGVTYKAFRTGLTYRDVYHQMWDHSQKRRNTILGSWHQLKLELWGQHIDSGCESDPRNVAALEAAE